MKSWNQNLVSFPFITASLKLVIMTFREHFNIYMQFVGVVLFNVKIQIAGSIIILMEQMKQQGSERSNKLFTVTQLIRF